MHMPHQEEVDEAHARAEGGGGGVALHEVVLHLAHDVCTHALLRAATPRHHRNQRAALVGPAHVHGKRAARCAGRAAAALACANLKYTRASTVRRGAIDSSPHTALAAESNILFFLTSFVLLTRARYGTSNWASSIPATRHVHEGGRGAGCEGNRARRAHPR